MNRVREKMNISWAHEKGIDGTGVGVAVVDTGLYRHKDFSVDKLMGFWDFVGNNKVSYGNEYDRYYDDNGHGTHVAGIIGANGNQSHGLYKGVAPGANLYIFKSLDSLGNGRLENVIVTINFIIKNAEKLGIRIVNISMGATINYNDARKVELVNAVERLWDIGVVVCVAAGNRGPGRGTITMPGVSPKVITVGFIDENIRYSSCGPTRRCIVKPEIVSEGINIVSCDKNLNGYVAKSGSSMSTPIVSGAIALLIQKYPYLSNKEIKMRLYERAVDKGYSKNIQGWGYLDIKRLLC